MGADHRGLVGGFGRNADGVDAIAKTRGGLRAQVRARVLEVLGVGFEEALVQGFEHQRSALIKTPPGLVHGDTEPRVFPARKPAPKAQERAPPALLVE